MVLPTTATAPVKKEFEDFRSYFNSLFSSNDANIRDLLISISERNGKMMRPLFCLLTARYFGDITPALFHVAASFEMLHTGSLVHDDVVDESNLRRGQASINSLYDNKKSVLIGDYLVGMSLQEMSASGLLENVSTLSEVAVTLSAGELIQQFYAVLDILDEDVYFDIIEKKTACLFSACGKAAAATCGASKELISTFEEIGRLAGLCFQIKDDIFDYSDSTEVGKPVGNDLKEGKFTLPAIYSLKNSDRDWSQLIHLVKSGKASPEEIYSIIEFTLSNGGIQYAENKMKELHDKALSLLPADMSADLRAAFTSYLDLIVERNK